MYCIVYSNDTQCTALCTLFSDIDECGDNIAQCDHGCNNTIGSYYCYCRTGFTLLDAGNGTCKGKFRIFLIFLLDSKHSNVATA